MKTIDRWLIYNQYFHKGILSNKIHRLFCFIDKLENIEQAMINYRTTKLNKCIDNDLVNIDKISLENKTLLKEVNDICYTNNINPYHFFIKFGIDYYQKLKKHITEKEIQPQGLESDMENDLYICMDKKYKPNKKKYHRKEKFIDNNSDIIFFNTNGVASKRVYQIHELFYYMCSYSKPIRDLNEYDLDIIRKNYHESIKPYLKYLSGMRQFILISQDLNFNIFDIEIDRDFLIQLNDKAYIENSTPYHYYSKYTNFKIELEKFIRNGDRYFIDYNI